MKYLRQNTSTTIRFGRFVDSTDAVTAETALTITPALRKLSKAGAAFAATSDGSNATHDSNGWYSCTLTSTDLNTAGPLDLEVVVSGACPFQQTFHVLPAQVYDAKFVHPLIGKAQTYGQAQAGGASSLTLATAASSVDNYYNGALAFLYGGTGAGQVNLIQTYTGSSRGAVMAWSWATTPDSSSLYAILPFSRISTLGEVADAVADEVYDGTYTLRQSTRLQNAALAGKLSGAAGTSVVIRDLSDAKNRISATVDSSGNRTAVTLDAT